MAAPYALVISNESGSTWIDLDSEGWLKRHQSLMRRPGRWFLIEKATARPILTLIVRDGDQPYYTARHIGIVGAGGSNEVIAYGIGKKTASGTERMWVLPNGAVCSGDDVDLIGNELVREAGPRR